MVRVNWDTLRPLGAEMVISDCVSINISVLLGLKAKGLTDLLVPGLRKNIHEVRKRRVLSSL
ncbi:MAG: hypothetical protein JWM21_1899 [Acidobacteria bacterium]|nr:hypothetical protein [Acidobacteriota bacterium]